MLINKQIFYTLISLVVVILFFEISDSDFYIQDFFYDFTQQMWLLNRERQPWKFLLYDGIKQLLILIALVFLVLYLFFKNHIKFAEYKKGILLVVLSAILIPIIVGGLKKSTNIPCPKNVIHYDGKMPKTAVWDSYIEPYKSMEHIACWPAGHASGGFVLMSLFFLFKKKRNKFIGVLIGLGLGWSMGVYKMLIGDHFLSHTIITMLISWICILCLYKILEQCTSSESSNCTEGTILTLKEKNEKSTKV